jgi:hypothetical protein
LHSFIPFFWIIKVRSSISKQGNLVLKGQIQPSAELDNNGLVVVVFCKVDQLLEAV